jgi:uncharacterized membrane protein
MLLIVHIAGGLVALAAGYTALLAAKGAKVHRRGGMLFVAAMGVMGVTATTIAAARGLEATMFGGVLVVYLVGTALATVRPPAAASRWMDAGAALLALALAAVFIAMGFTALARPGGSIDGIPAPPIFMNGVVALLAGIGDLRMVRAGPPRGARRLARHLWRMCFALWIAAGSAFLGQADELPRALRVWPVLVMLAVAPLAAMAYWLWRLRGRRAAAVLHPPVLRPRIVEA